MAIYIAGWSVSTTNGITFGSNVVRAPDGGVAEEAVREKVRNNSNVAPYITGPIVVQTEAVKDEFLLEAGWFPVADLQALLAKAKAEGRKEALGEVADTGGE
jgi:hypothetical protein